MVKKISAILLALVLCLSVMLVPTSAEGFADDYELADGQLAAVKIELDKEYVSAGDTVTVSVYLKLAEGQELTTSALVFGINSAVFDTTTNKNTVIKASAVGSDSFNLLYKPATGLTWAVLKDTSTNGKKVEAENTAEENALYDNYIKVSLARNTDGNYDTVTGLPAEDIGNEAFLTFELTAKTGLADGTPVNIGMTSGAWSSEQAYIGLITEPGVDGTVAKPTPAQYDSTGFVIKTQIGAPAPAVSVYAKTSQVRYNSAETNGKGSANFDVRTRAAMSAEDFDKICTYDASTKATNIEEVGFIYAYSTVGLTLDNAKAVVGGTAVNGYVKKTVSHIQTTGTEYVWTCLITDADYADAVDSVGYIIVDGTPYFFDAVYATDFSDLYDAQSSHIPTA